MRALAGAALSIGGVFFTLASVFIAPHLGGLGLLAFAYGAYLFVDGVLD